MADEEEDPKTITRKPKVIEYIFEKRYDPTTGEIADPIVKSDALVDAIEECNKRPGKTLSTKNPANFLKDYLRSPKRNELWPAALKSARITARQKYRKGRVFAFAPPTFSCCQATLRNTSSSPYRSRLPREHWAEETRLGSSKFAFIRG